MRSREGKGGRVARKSGGGGEERGQEEAEAEVDAKEGEDAAVEEVRETGGEREADLGIGFNDRLLGRGRSSSHNGNSIEMGSCNGIGEPSIQRFNSKLIFDGSLMENPVFESQRPPS